MKLKDINISDIIKFIESSTELKKLDKYLPKETIDAYMGLVLSRAGFYGKVIGEQVYPLKSNELVFNTSENVIILVEGIVILNKVPVNIGSGGLSFSGYGILEVNDTIVYNGRGSSVPKLATPTNFTATATSDTEIGLSWDDVTDEISYSIERSADGSTGWVEVLTPAANVTTAANTGLTAETEYFYRNKAVGDGVNYLDSNYSPVVSATTQSVPTGPTVSSYSIGNINENQLEIEIQID